MARRTFVDTSGFYALVVKRGRMHKQAGGILTAAARGKGLFVTSDYVLDETATLLKACGCARLLPGLFETVFGSQACHVEWMDPSRFAKTQSLFLKYGDHAWSFTDCFSFVLMRELRIKGALTTDEHFTEAGFAALLV